MTMMGLSFSCCGQGTDCPFPRCADDMTHSERMAYAKEDRYAEIEAHYDDCGDKVCTAATFGVSVRTVTRAIGGK